MGCTVYKRVCREHGFQHGAEAEELRHGIEDLLESSEANFVDDYETLSDLRKRLRRLLDRVDARDSLAFRERNDTAEKACGR